MNPFIILFPPILVFALAIITHNVMISLFCGIIAAALSATNFSPLQATYLMANTFLTQVQSINNLYVFGFLTSVGILIMLITHVGGIKAYTGLIKKIITHKKNAERTSLLLSFSFFIDDYLNSLMVGSIMRPITDTFRIPRIKLAFLIDAMSASLCMIIPATSWVAMVLSQLRTAGVSEHAADAFSIVGDPFYIYLCTIPFIFYPILNIVSAWFIVSNNISYSIMEKHEKIAEQTGNLFGNKATRASKKEHFGEGTFNGFLVPMGSFLVSAFVAFLYSGNHILFGGNNNFFTALQAANSLWALWIAGATSVIISVIFFSIQRILSLRLLGHICYEGFDLVRNGIIILFFAWSFSYLLIDKLEAGVYLAQLVSENLPLFLLPLILFGLATLSTIITGSSWGTIGVLVPLTIRVVAVLPGEALPILFERASLLLPALGAVLAGAVAGGHFSPITDATVIASTSAGSYHLDHVYSQIPYALPALIGTIVSLLIVGNMPTTNGLLIALPTGIIVTLMFILLFDKTWSRITKRSRV